MRTCGHCGDTYSIDAIHECWVIAKNATQERLAPPAVTDYASSRQPLSDATWHATHSVKLD